MRVDGEKECSKCSTTKLRTDFYANPGMKDGLLSWCKDCHKERIAAAAAKNPDVRKKWGKQYRKKRQETASAERMEAARRKARKRCAKCRRMFPATIDYFRRHDLGQWGLHPRCRTCNSSKRRN